MEHKVRQRVTKLLSTGVILMGIIHDAATFTPLINDKLTALDGGGQCAFTYFSLMCGALLIVGGVIILMLTEKVAEHDFLCKPYSFMLIVLALDGILAVCFMPSNPFAWIIFALTLLLLLANIKLLFRKK